MLSALRALARVYKPGSPSTLKATAWRAASIQPLARRTPTISPLSLLSFARAFHSSPPAFATLNQATRRRASKKKKIVKSPLLGNCTHKKGVVSSIFIAKPKKPNSAKRKVARVKLTNGRTVQAYIMGEGHNLQEHNVVLVRGGRTQDLPGVRYVP
ncbi:hypothetical protein PHLCEN_2v9513 [Hermanssonia centrifuga]|uniref:Ribosomal protein S12 n=1 Tax=Hermanssonia centrifuga TaxID=98765 RepID=A0A2R6NQG0_9APHY|nr:hypothetical protein PHLCEN_2v9513 [Hermanssonia centrifuga]